MPIPRLFQPSWFFCMGSLYRFYTSLLGLKLFNPSGFTLRIKIASISPNRYRIDIYNMVLPKGFFLKFQLARFQLHESNCSRFINSTHMKSHIAAIFIHVNTVWQSKKTPMRLLQLTMGLKNSKSIIHDHYRSQAFLLVFHSKIALRRIQA